MPKIYVWIQLLQVSALSDFACAVPLDYAKFLSSSQTNMSIARYPHPLFPDHTASHHDENLNERADITKPPQVLSLKAGLYTLRVVLERNSC